MATTRAVSTKKPPRRPTCRVPPGEYAYSPGCPQWIGGDLGRDEMSLSEPERRLTSVRQRIFGLLGVRPQEQPVQDRTRLEQLEQRLEHLESLVEGLQDAVHRDAVRHEKRLSELETKTDPEAVAKALSDDARRRGL